MKYINKFMAAFFIFNFFLILSNIPAQQPATVLWQSDKDHIFSGEGIDFATANITLTIKDSSGQTVPEGTMIGISYDWADLRSPARFYSYVDTLNDFSWYFYRTDNQGKINILYYPKYIPSYAKSLTNNLTEYSNYYSLKKQLTGHIMEAKLTGAGDSTAAFVYDNVLKIDDTSNMGILVSVDSVKVTSTGRDGNNYIFAAFNGKVDEDLDMLCEFFDQFGNPVPENIPVGMIALLDEPDDYKSDNIFYNWYGDYYCKTNSLGQVLFKYSPTNLSTMGSGSSYFYYGSWSEVKKNYGSDSTGWSFFKDNRTPRLTFFAVPFYTNGSPITRAWNWYFNQRAQFLKRSGELPFIIGPDKISITTTGVKNGDNYLFTNPTIVEPAKIKIQMFDDIGRPVPKGTPVLIRTTYPYLAPEAGNGFVTGANFDNPEFWGLYGFTNQNGELNFIYTPPFAAPHAIRPYDALLVNTSQRNYNGPYFTEGSTVPILVGLVHGFVGTNDAAKADIFFYPPQLTSGKISSKVKIQVLDQMGRPALRGSTVRISVNKGFIDGDKTSVVRTLRENGKVTAFYLSPTRRLGYDGDVTLSVSGWSNDNYYDYHGDWRTINEKTMKMTGYAVNPMDYSLTKFLFGKNISDVLNDLNPVKALGSMKNLSKSAEIAREKRKKLYRIVGDPNSTDEQIRLAEQEFQNSFAVVRQDIAQFIKDVPGTSFNPNLPQSGFGLYSSLLQNGLRRHIVSTISKTLTTEQVKQATIRYIETKLKTKIFPGALKYDNNQTSSIGNAIAGNYTGRFDVSFDGPFYIGESETRMHEAFGIKFKVSDFGDIVFNRFNVGDQDLLPKEFIPSEVGGYISGGESYESVGLFEVISIDSITQTIEFAAVGEVFPSPNNVPQAVTAVTLRDTSNTTLEWLDGSGVSFTSGSVLDSANLFLAGIPAPGPINVDDSLVIHSAYAFGRITQDSLIEPLTLLTPAKFEVSLSEIIADSLSKAVPKPYIYNEANKSWDPLQIDNSNSPDTMIFSISSTGIYGIGWNPGSFISSVNNTDKIISFQLNQNYPNPFNPSTIISYQLSKAGKVSLIVYDILGREVKTLVNKEQNAGFYKVKFDASSLSSGVYFYRISAGDFIQSRKMIILK